MCAGGGYARRVSGTTTRSWCRRTRPRRSRCCGCPPAGASATRWRSRSRSRSASTATPVAVTMRTPGHDEELALGFCLSEGPRPTAARCRTTSPRTRSRSRRPLRPGAAAAQLLHHLLVRRLRQRRARGGRGRGAARRERGSVAAGAARRAARSAPRRSSRPSRPPAGCTRPGLFDAAGELLCLREDVGRHNAMDKVIGWAFAQAGCRSPTRPLRQRPALLRARAEGRRRRLPAPRRCRRALEPRGRARARPRHHALRLRRATAALNVYTEPWRVQA